jgi:hypothetical protein
VPNYLDTEILLLILKKAVQYFNYIDISDLSYICLNSGLLSNINYNNRRYKEEFLEKLSKLIITEQAKLIQTASRKTILQLIIGFVVNKKGTPDLWHSLMCLF